MKSAQTMLKSRSGSVGLLRAACLVSLASLGLASCERAARPLIAPRTTVAPYASLQGEPVWAVVPLSNESGVSFADDLEVSDAVVRAVEQVRGLRCLPLNRTIATMRSLGMYEGVGSPAEARALARAMGADGILVGSITHYDPYSPPKLGLSLAYFGVTTTGGAEIDPRTLSRATRGEQADGFAAGDQPQATSSLIYDARGHDVQLRIEDFARGRTTESGEDQWRLYLLSMDLYTGFVAHHAVRELIDQEWIRLARTGRGDAPDG